MANDAFDAMNESVGSDMYITGGAITVSEYEQNMTPEDQMEYENTLMGLFQTAYQNDSLLRKYPNVSFKHWLSTIDGDDWRYKAEDYDESRQKGQGSDFSYPGDAGGVQTYEAPVQFNQNEQIYLLQRLAHLHTGLIEDIVKIVEPLVQEEVGGPPQVMGRDAAPPQAGLAPSQVDPLPDESLFEGGGDQGPF
tara:strand:+ start:394 stop:972 length:579 start_codon:yes stop_codon:yes gene_type:complete